MDQVEPLAVLRKLECKGQVETAKRLRSFASRVFRYAVATARAKSDPDSLLVGAALRPLSLAAIVEPKQAGAVLRAIEANGTQPATRFALALSPHVFVRPGELRQAEWSGFDIDAAARRIPALRMKQRREHVAPESRQCVEILATREVTGGGATSSRRWVGATGPCPRTRSIWRSGGWGSISRR